MKLGLHLGRWNWDDDPVSLAPKLREIARLSEDVGIASLSVMDHFFQIPHNGRLEILGADVIPLVEGFP